MSFAIIDASVLVKWFAEEEGSSQAIQLRDAHYKGEIVLLVLDLTFLEVINALIVAQLNN